VPFNKPQSFIDIHYSALSMLIHQCSFDDMVNYDSDTDDIVELLNQF